MGCKFHPRCPYMTEECKAEDPPLLVVGQGHTAACIHHDQVELQREVVEAASSVAFSPRFVSFVAFAMRAMPVSL